MRALLQRVSRAAVCADGRTLGEIGPGLLVLVGIEPQDGKLQLEKMLHKLLNYRVFSDEQGRMNLSVRDVQGGLLLVSQFTLAADTRSGLRPGFSTAAAPELAEPLFEQLVDMAKAAHTEVACGEFAANMQVSLINDGPVTFLLEV